MSYQPGYKIIQRGHSLGAFSPQKAVAEYDRRIAAGDTDLVIHDPDGVAIDPERLRLHVDTIKVGGR
jgi:hypothetical protein